MTSCLSVGIFLFPLFFLMKLHPYIHPPSFREMIFPFTFLNFGQSPNVNALVILANKTRIVWCVKANWTSSWPIKLT